MIFELACDTAIEYTLHGLALVTQSCPIHILYTPPAGPPTVEAVVSLLRCVAVHWRAIAEGLGFDEDHIDEIDTNNETDVACLQDCMKQWMRLGPTWKKLALVLSDVGEDSLAQQAWSGDDVGGSHSQNSEQFVFLVLRVCCMCLPVKYCGECISDCMKVLSRAYTVMMTSSNNGIYMIGKCEHTYLSQHLSGRPFKKMMMMKVSPVCMCISTQPQL